VGSPGDKVYGSGVEGYFVDLLPGVGLLAPDEDLAVVGTGCKDVAVLGMCPCDAPDSAFVSTSLSMPDTDTCVMERRRTLAVSQPVCASRPPLRRS
jgi:hypothetical protein